MLRRGVPVVMEVETERERVLRVWAAAVWRAGIRAGPGKR